MSKYLETTVGKFIFRVVIDRSYSNQGVWAQLEGGLVRIGLSDFVQQSSGDVAFADIKPVGTPVKAGEEVGVIETIKVNLSILSPVSGKVIEVNTAMDEGPEVINQDPYGAGWLAVIEADDWKTDSARLLDPQAYFEAMKEEAEEEVKKL